jgi:2-ketoarginine methyltransferase
MRNTEGSSTPPIEITNRSPHEQLPLLLEYVAKWATAEILRGLLSHPELCAALAKGTTEHEISRMTGASRRQLRSLLQALEVEQIVVEHAGIWSLTPFGTAAIGPLSGWFELFLQGYGEYFRHADALWAGQPDPRWRDMRAVGRASINISRHGALPLVARLIGEHNPDAKLVVDVGCADATYLVELCASYSDLHGLGVEPSDQLRKEARDLISRAGLEHRISVVESIESLSAQPMDPAFFVFGFSLHELVEQRGRGAVVDMLRDIGSRHPDSRLLVVEADYGRRDDVEAMRSDAHLRGYYNYYYMLHDFTDQILLTRSQWREIFHDAGYVILEERAIDPDYDPTGLEIAFVLSSSVELTTEDDS